MTPEEAKANLNNILAAVYQDARYARMAVNYAGIDASLIDWSGGVKILWHDILQVAENTGKIDSLFEVVLKEHSENQKVVQAIDAYRALDVQEARQLSGQSESSTVQETSQQENERRLRVFLCHASRDKAAVRSLYQQLRDDGIEPWLDEANLLPGQRWQEEIPKAIRRADVVVVFLSKRSVNSKGYAQKEIEFALDEAEKQSSDSIVLVPVRLENCNVPERLTRWHWVDLFVGGGYGRLIQALQERSQELGVQEPRETLPPREYRAPSNWKPLFSRRALIYISGAVFLIAAIVIINFDSLGGLVWVAGQETPVSTPSELEWIRETLTAATRTAIQTAEAIAVIATDTLAPDEKEPRPTDVSKPTRTMTNEPTPTLTSLPMLTSAARSVPNRTLPETNTPVPPDKQLTPTRQPTRPSLGSTPSNLMDGVVAATATVAASCESYSADVQVDEAQVICAEIVQTGSGHVGEIVTDTLVFQVWAYAPNVDAVDGMGIMYVEFEIYTEDKLVWTKTEYNAPYCAFGDSAGSLDCHVWKMVPYSSTWPGSDIAIVSGSYVLRAKIVDFNGEELTIERRVILAIGDS